MSLTHCCPINLYRINCKVIYDETDTSSSYMHDMNPRRRHTNKTGLKERE